MREVERRAGAMSGRARFGTAVRTFTSFVLMVSLGGVAGGEPASGSVVLREPARGGECTRVQIELKAEGLFQPGLPPQAAAEARLPKPLSLEVQTRSRFRERLLGEGFWGAGRGDRRPAEASPPRGLVARSVRWVEEAASAIQGDVRPTASRLRAELSLLVVGRSEPGGEVVVASPAGPLTRSELELVQGVGDPLVLPDLLPQQPVASGESWKVPASALPALTGYDTVQSSSLEATLASVADDSARILLKGTVAGSVLGGPGSMECEGQLIFDRTEELVTRLELNRRERRDPGPVEAGLDVKSSLVVVRRRVPVPTELADAALAAAPLDLAPERQLLQFISPDGKFDLLHDRHWHLYWDDPKLAVLKRIDHGKVVAQCNLTAGPFAGKGKHQDVNQFRDELRQALKQRFIRFLGAGEVDGEAEGGFRYKVAVQGREGELGVLWYYYLLASPEGDQWLATFTLAEADAQVFGDQDLQMIGSLRWTDPAPAAERR